MSVLLDELAEWFETLWTIYDPPEVDQVEASYVTPECTLFAC